MIKITATAESIEQAKKLLDAGVDTLYIGEGTYGLRLPHNFTWEEIREITNLAHEAGKAVTVAVNALMHPEKMKNIKEYLDFLQDIQVDKLTVGDTGVIFVLKRDGYNLPYIYDASTMVTSARQVNFWAEHDAKAAVLARELPKDELVSMSQKLNIPGEILVYGATIIHQTKRPLLQNYYNFIKTDEDYSYERGLFLSEPKDESTHYSVFEDDHGTHIFASDDVDMMPVLKELTDMDFVNWKLEGIYCPGDDFVEIAKLFVEARTLIEVGKFTADKAYQLDEEVRKLHPKGRTLGRGFYDFAPDDIK
ncbi:peptidase U32 family protein [Floricoccus penangensis]|uniref:peptidase U32 family protein n=1 Tax=Floricoccus penangensis TaxID=1859475 RepID=UPI00203CCD04|nr:peptidase U32 family protein [Floricoccus penangensis]URZ87093.1 U32 family peptidase [Floricoccus penangensis]